jgi:hypothetical protein
MAQRKETPDLLAEMLGADTTSEVSVEDVQTEPPAAKQPAVKRPRKAKLKGWEYIVVTFQDYNGWRPRFENGQEYKGWMELPLLHEYINDLSSEGWELVTASAGERMYGSADKHQLFFRRIKTN